MPTGGDLSERVIIFAPVGKDSELISSALEKAQVFTVPVHSPEEFVGVFASGCGAIVLTEEALHLDYAFRMVTAASDQPSWSEAPFVVLTKRGEPDERIRRTLQLVKPLLNVMLLERPVRPNTLVMAVETALRDRQRQYDVRNALESLQSANAELEKRVEIRTGELLAKVTELEGFCYSVSHDMRSPLRAIVANSKMVLEENSEGLSNEGILRLNRLSSAALKMAQLIEDLLLYARLGESYLKFEDFCISDLLKRVVSEDEQFESPDRYKIVITPDLVAHGDSRLIGLVLQNFLSNALKYRIPSKMTLLEFGQRKNGEFYFRDNGIGFDMEYAERIFRPFERLHRDDEFPGTGIGLANVKRIIEKHHGKVWAVASEGNGSTFFFNLPRPA